MECRISLYPFFKFSIILKIESFFKKVGAIEQNLKKGLVCWSEADKGSEAPQG